MQSALLISLVAVSGLLIVSVIVEWMRYRDGGADSFTVFYIIYSIQCLVPPILIFISILVGGAKGGDLDNIFFSHVYSSLAGYHILVVTYSICFFLVTSYFSYGWVCHHKATNRIAQPTRLRLVVRPRLHICLVVVGLLSGLYLLYNLGSSVLDGYKLLIQFRNLDEAIERNFVNANLFSLTQTFLFLALLGPFVSSKGGKVSSNWPVWLLVIIALALLCVSRRSLIIAGLICLFTLLLAKQKVKIRYWLGLVCLGLAAVFIGKNILYYLSADSGAIVRPERPIADDVLYISSDVGITVTESLGTVALVDMPMRFGVDHAYSIMRRFPTGMLGWESPVLPERIVRVTTGIFAGPREADIPPGLFGQMWLDFRFAGPFLYGLYWGIGLGLLERIRKRFILDLQSSSIFALVLFIYCLPINTGSLDFTFSVDIIALAFLLLGIVKIVRPNHRAVASIRGVLSSNGSSYS